MLFRIAVRKWSKLPLVIFLCFPTPVLHSRDKRSLPVKTLFLVHIYIEEVYMKETLYTCSVLYLHHSSDRRNVFSKRRPAGQSVH